MFGSWRAARVPGKGIDLAAVRKAGIECGTIEGGADTWEGGACMFIASIGGDIRISESLLSLLGRSVEPPC